nr:Abi family protein [Acholeplasma equirhinis]
MPTGNHFDMLFSGLKGNITELNYVDYQKILREYVNEYYHPPLWVIIKTLMFNDLILLLYGLNTSTFNLILSDFGLTPGDKAMFLNSLEILRELRNYCAHGEIITRFRTSNVLEINSSLIRKLNLSTKRIKYIIKLSDSIKVLNLYVNTNRIKTRVQWFYFKNVICGRKWLNKKFKDRIGEM